MANMAISQPVFAEMGGEYEATKKLQAASYRHKRRLESLWSSLESERSSWDSHWRDIAKFIIPRRVRFDKSDRNKGDKRNQAIINNAGTIALRTLRSGMMAGLTSPARPWFKLGLFDEDLLEDDAVKFWLDDVSRRMYSVMSRSNLYNSLPIGYGDLGAFGTTAIALLEDDEKVFRTTVPPLGSYVISNNERGIVDVFARECEMTVRQIVMRFGRQRDKSGTLDLSNMSLTVRNLWMGDNFEASVPVKHFILPNEAYDPEAYDPAFKRYRSVYYEDGTSDTYLSESGYDEFPLLCPRWDVLGEDAYGTSPGMDALGDVKSLQVLERRKAQATEKMVNPPMTGPNSLRNQKATLLAGDITYVDAREGQQGFRPAHEVNYPVKEVIMDIQEHQKRISRAFYEDLFLMLTLSDRREITAREIEERHQEKLIMLGPVMERLNDELLDPMIDRVFAIMDRRGLIPPAPEVLSGGQPLRVEYVSIMAQAQRMVNIAGMERYATFVRQLGEIDPNVLVKANTDYMVEEYAVALSQPPRVVRSDEEVAAIRKQIQDRQMAQERAQNVEAMAKAGKAMATSPTDQPSVLNRLMERLDSEQVSSMANT